jgi:hypothetical protein
MPGITASGSRASLTQKLLGVIGTKAWGAALLTTSGVILTFLVAVRGLLSNDPSPTGRVQSIALAVGVSALLLATMLKPRPVLSIDSLWNLVGEPRWTEDESIAANTHAQLRIQTITRLRSRNNWNARILIGGLWGSVSWFRRTRGGNTG